MFQFFSAHSRYKFKQQKKNNKIIARYWMYCLQY